jgi:hypothetical protein
MVTYPINDQWVKNHPHKLILIKQIVNHQSLIGYDNFTILDKVISLTSTL